MTHGAHRQRCDDEMLSAHEILDRAKAGENVPAACITLALKILGDC